MLLIQDAALANYPTIPYLLKKIKFFKDFREKFLWKPPGSAEIWPLKCCHRDVAEEIGRKSQYLVTS
jgi:hypothetical protein